MGGMDAINLGRRIQGDIYGAGVYGRTPVVPVEPGRLREAARKTMSDRAFAYVDGRFMYAAVCSELGVGPGERLNRAATADLLRENPYARARIHVSFTVPQDWNHIGIFGVRHESVREGWYWPNRPGATGHTWIDAAEWHVAQRFGWQVDPIESVVFNTRTPAARDRNRLTAARPLDTWQARLTEARAAVAADAMMSETIKTAVTAAMIEPLTDDADVKRGLADLVVAVFG